jgi:hypothetical protein
MFGFSGEDGRTRTCPEPVEGLPNPTRLSPLAAALLSHAVRGIENSFQIPLRNEQVKR